MYAFINAYKQYPISGGRELVTIVIKITSCGLYRRNNFRARPELPGQTRTSGSNQTFRVIKHGGSREFAGTGKHESGRRQRVFASHAVGGQPSLLPGHLPHVFVCSIGRREAVFPLYRKTEMFKTGLGPSPGGAEPDV